MVSLRARLAAIPMSRLILFLDFDGTLWIEFNLIIKLSGFPRRITTAFSHGSQCEQAQLSKV
jgi:hypothetical protein